MWSVLNNRR